MPMLRRHRRQLQDGRNLTGSVWKRPQRSRSSRAGIVVFTGAEEIAILRTEASINSVPDEDSKSRAMAAQSA